MYQEVQTGCIAVVGLGYAGTLCGQLLHIHLTAGFGQAAVSAADVERQSRVGKTASQKAHWVSWLMSRVATQLLRCVAKKVIHSRS